MDLKEQIYSILVVSASENFNNALSGLLPAFRYAPVRYVSGISAAKRILSERDFDFLILNSPLPDGPGTDLAIDFSSSSGGIALLIVRSDMLHRTVCSRLLNRCRSRCSRLLLIGWPVHGNGCGIRKGSRFPLRRKCGRSAWSTGQSGC